MKTKELYIDLGYIGHKADNLKALFSEYANETPNEYGMFLKFENHTALVVNQGVMVHTNCFTSEKHFREILMTKLLFNL